MLNQTALERIAIAFGIAVIAGAVWFYSMQVGDTLETLRLAYPEYFE